MTNLLYSSTHLSSENERLLNRLKRTITLSQGQFSLILASCNSSILRLQIANELHKVSSVPIEELTLHPGVNTLFTTLQTALEDEPLPSALMVFGLESVNAIEELLGATNLVRNKFRDHFPFPVILWVNDDLLQTFRRVAPDLRSWAGNPIRFEEVEESFSEEPLRNEVHQSYSDSEVPLDNNLIRWSSFKPIRYRKTKKPVMKSSAVKSSEVKSSAQWEVKTGVVIFEPKQLTEIFGIAKVLRDLNFVIVNLTHLPPEEAQRSVDFLSGTTFATDGDQEKLGEGVFLFTPNSIQITTSEPEELSRKELTSRNTPRNDTPSYRIVPSLS
ncbi:MAG: cell division protein SepF [Cyanobacteriota bacterium]